MPLVRLAALLAGDADAARDIVQDCYEAVWRLRPDVGDPEHFVAYLRKAVLNWSRSRLRRLRTVRRFLAQSRPPADAPPVRCSSPSCIASCSGTSTGCPHASAR